MFKTEYNKLNKEPLFVGFSIADLFLDDAYEYYALSGFVQRPRIPWTKIVS